MLPRSRRRLAVAALSLALLVALSSMALAIGYEEAPAVGGTYVEAVVGSPRYLNPLLARSGDVDDDVTRLVFSGLTRVTPEGEVLPDLARDWEISADGLTYVLRLRSDVLWHDGQRLTADDVIFTFHALHDPQFRGPAALSTFWRQVKVEELDEGTVRFTLKQPFAPFLEYASLGILPSHLLAALPAQELPASQFNSRPIGTGPYQVLEADPRQVTLEANPHYGGQRPYLTRVQFRYYPTAQAALQAFRQGEVLGLRNVPPEHAVELSTLKAANVYMRPFASKLALLLLNLRHPLFAEKAVRQAMASAIDCQRVADAALGGRAVPAWGPLGRSYGAHDRAPRQHGYQPERARRLLETAGWLEPAPGQTRQRGGQRLEFVLLTNDEPERIRAAEEISRQLQAVGIRAEVHAAGWTGLVQDFLVPGRFHAVLTEQWSPTADPDPYAFWHSSQAGDGLNLGSWVNPQADELLEQARRVLRREERARLYGEFLALFAEETPSVPLYHPVYAFAVDRKVKGVQVGPLHRPSDRLANIADWYTRTRWVPRSF